jgi:phosphate transport system substrate-binding protein
MNRPPGLAVALALAVFWPGTLGTAQAQGKKIAGEIKADGSSTVFLITEGVASKFKKLYEGVNISVGVSGTGGGLRKFQNSELDICDASRKMRDTEAEACKKNGVDFLELQVAWDGIAVVTHKENNFAAKLTVEQLKKIWHPDTATFKNAKTWKDVDPAFPDVKMDLYGPGKDSGTFDYFTEQVNGKERLIRQDYNGNANPDVLVRGIAENKNALGFFGAGYYNANKEKLNLVAIAAKTGGEYLLPTEENILARKYPISRPLYIYVSAKALQRAEVRAFVDFYLRHSDLGRDAGFVEMNTLQKFRERQKFEAAIKE